MEALHRVYAWEFRLGTDAAVKFLANSRNLLKSIFPEVIVATYTAFVPQQANACIEKR